MKNEKHFRQSKKVRFLFNEPTFIKRIESNQKEVKEFQLQMTKRERSLSEFPIEINLKNNLDQNQIASRVFQFVNEKVDVKSVLNANKVTASAFNIKNTNRENFLINGSNVSFLWMG